MARTPEGASLTEAHRRVQAKLLAVAATRLALAWRRVDPTDLRGTLDAPLIAGVSIVQRGRLASATASQTYYTEFRAAEGLSGTADVPLADAPPDEHVRGLLLGAGVTGIRGALRRGASVAAARDNGLVKLVGSATHLVAGGGRDTILGAVLRDPGAHGYQRVTDAQPCAFCSMIAGRGVIRHTESSAGFQAHGHCGCTAEPAFEGSQINPRNATFRDAWQTATAGLSGPEALAAFRDHLAGLPG